MVERFFNKIKRCRRIATRYGKLAETIPRHPVRPNQAMASR
jgi:transposase